MKTPLKIGIIGNGSIGGCHAANCAKNSDVRITALCDLLEDRTARIAAAVAPGAQQFSDYRQLLAQADVDAVFVCLPNYLHAPVAIAGLEAGKDVFCEKPMTISVAAAQDMVAAARQARRKGQILQIGMVWRQDARVQTIRQLIASGLCGTIYHIRTTLIRRRGIPGLGGWFTTKKLAGAGALMDIGVHWIDTSMFLADAWKPRTVSAVNHAKFGPTMRDYAYQHMWSGPPNYEGTFDVEDYTSGLVRFAGGLSMNFNIAWAANGPDAGFIELLGEQGGLIFAPGQDIVLRTTKDRKVVDLPQPIVGNEDYFARQLRLFVAACRGEGEVPATPEQGLVVVKLLEGVAASAKAGREVVVK